MRRPVTTALGAAAALAGLALAGCVYSDEPLITGQDAAFPIADGEYVGCARDVVAADCGVVAFRRGQDGYSAYSFDPESDAFIRADVMYRLTAIKGYGGRAYLVEQSAGSRSDYGLLLVVDGGMRGFIPSCDELPAEFRETIQNGSLAEFETDDYVDSCKLTNLASAKEFIAGWLDAGGVWEDEVTYYPLSNG